MEQEDETESMNKEGRREKRLFMIDVIGSFEEEGFEEIMADHVHQEMTRNWILVAIPYFTRRKQCPSHAFLGWINPTGDFRLPSLGEQEQVSLFFLGGAEQSKKKAKKMIVLKWLFLTIAPCDAAEPWQLGSQDAATPMMQGIIDLHHDTFSSSF
ncbi:cytochrome c oxidase subunit 2 [Cucumis melo var. makuwa]|uniref:Cytochrome c oxidase subunit 2 n=1 Tax=Cucumis melo var. makuwa TaxID=1194695 RepID=A0A5A7U5K2_CUCMM|nr:cytochrome c oxidase subunit 2 [Cucumis melo var. makuwa]